MFGIHNCDLLILQYFQKCNKILSITSRFHIYCFITNEIRQYKNKFLPGHIGQSSNSFENRIHN